MSHLEACQVSKKIAVYGVYETKARVPVPQRYVKKRAAYSYMRRGKLVTAREGKQRYWKKPIREKKVEAKGRYEFKGSGKELYKAVAKAHTYMPRDYIEVPAKEFLEKPEEYGVRGEWVEREVESP